MCLARCLTCLREWHAAILHPSWIESCSSLFLQHMQSIYLASNLAGLLSPSTMHQLTLQALHYNYMGAVT